MTIIVNNFISSAGRTLLVFFNLKALFFKVYRKNPAFKFSYEIRGKIKDIVFKMLDYSELNSFILINVSEEELVQISIIVKKAIGNNLRG